MGPPHTAALWRILDSAYEPGANGLIKITPNKRLVNEIEHALKAAAHLPASSVQLPAWLGEDRHNSPPPMEILVCQNGLLHLPTMALLLPTPNFFSTNVLEFDYDPEAPSPEKWIAFLNQLWPDDPDSIQALQEIFGYLLLPATHLQKIFLLIGPKRAGKGTIGRVLTSLIGQANVAAPTLSAFRQNFGLQTLIGRQLALISDARLDRRSGHDAVTERLLTISGEDSITIDRKYLTPWTGRLLTRIMILTNELFQLGDASGALASRFFVLRLSESFYGREDSGLTDRLLTELPGILNWAIEGYQRLRERGHLEQPASGEEVVTDLYSASSPIQAFIDEKCEVGTEFAVGVDTLFIQWTWWRDRMKIDWTGNAATFGRELRAVVPHLDTKQRWVDGKKVRFFHGVKLR